MFLRSIWAGGHEYLCLVENRRVEGRHRQRVVQWFGRADRLDRAALEEAIARGVAVRPRRRGP